MNESIEFTANSPQSEDSTFSFNLAGQIEPVIDIRYNGDVLIKGEKIENNRALYDALVAFAHCAGFYKNKLTEEQQKLVDSFSVREEPTSEPQKFKVILERKLD